MVTIVVAVVFSEGAYGGGTRREERQSEFLTKKQSVGVRGKVVVREAAWERVHQNASGW